MRKLKNEELGRPSITEYKAINKYPVVMILDNVRSLNNVGSIFRTTDAFLFEAIYLCGITGTPPHKEIHKTALGATAAVRWKYFGDTGDAVNDLRQSGYSIYSVEQAEGSEYLTGITIDKNKKYALIFGHEVKGVQQEIVDMCDGCIEIPQYGTKHSLNIAVSAGVVAWHFFLGYQ